MIRRSISCTVRALHTIPDELFRKEKLSEIPKLPDSVVSIIGKYFTNLRDIPKLGEIRNIIAFEDVQDVIALVGTAGSRYFPVTPKEYEESKSCTFSNRHLSSKEHDILEKMRQEMMRTWQFTAQSTLPRSQSTQRILEFLRNPQFIHACKNELAKAEERTIDTAFVVPPLKGKNWDVAINVKI